jgi:alanine-synthesizing transaminase
MRFSDRTSFAGRDPSRFARLLDDKKKEALPFWDLTESNPTRCGFASLDARLLAPLHDPRNLVYDPDPQGLFEAREAVSSYYASKNITVSPDRVFLTSGTSEAYTFLFHLLADPSDEILCVSPGYPLFEHLAAMADVNLRHLTTSHDLDWALDVRQFEENMSAKTKALILVNPNNPTGHYPQLLEGPLPLISDEVFLDFDLPDSEASATKASADVPPAGGRKSAASLTQTLTFTLSGVSKILGLPQMKLSWIVVGGPEQLCREACRRLEVIADAYLSVNTPSQRSLGAWLARRTDYIEEVRRRILSNLEFLQDALKGLEIELHRPEGGWYAPLRLHGPLNDEEAAIHLLQEKNVLVHPGFFFNFEEENILVLSLLPQESVFRQAVKRFRDGFSSKNLLENKGRVII